MSMDYEERVQVFERINNLEQQIRNLEVKIEQMSNLIIALHPESCS